MDVDINSYMNDLSIELRSDIESREDKKNRDIVRQITIGNRIYKIIGRYVDFKNKDRDKKGKKEYMIILHFIDDTENVKLQKEYKDSKSCVGIIMVDNYEETIRG